jgi:tetratricopeptide (TPR) repeat protein
MLKIRDYESGIPIIINNFDSLFDEGKYEYLWGWFSSIDKSLIDRNPYLIFYLGILYKYFIGDLKSSLEYLQKAIAGLKFQKDTDFLIKCYINKAGVLLNLGRTHEVIDELTGLLSEEIPPENKSKLLFYLGLAYYQSAKYDISINFLNKSLDICVIHRITELERNIYILLGHINLIKGNYKQSITYYENITDSNPNIIDRFETLCNLTL